MGISVSFGHLFIYFFSSLCLRQIIACLPHVSDAGGFSGGGGSIDSRAAVGKHSGEHTRGTRVRSAFVEMKPRRKSNLSNLSPFFFSPLLILITQL